jgi:hypothetical protein
MGNPSPKLVQAIIDRRTGLPVQILGEVVNQQELFTLPPMDTVLWRYSDYQYIRSIIAEGRIYFRRADKFKDPLEGRFTEGNRERPSSMFAAAAGKLPMVQVRAIQETHRSHVFLSCWHKNPVENERMWPAYTTCPEAIAVKTDVASLFAATPGHIRGADVNYVNEGDSIPEFHSLAALVHKRREPYEFENEFRLIYQLPLSEIERPDDQEDEHRWIPVDARRLLHLTRFHPSATPEFMAMVRRDLDAAGLPITLGKSVFAKEAGV